MNEAREQVRDFISESKRNLTKIRAMVFPLTKADESRSEPGKSKELPEDYIQGLIKAGDIIEPPFDLLQLATLPEMNSELTPCISAMEINIEGFGHRLVSRVRPEKITGDLKIEIEKERLWLENFFLYASIDDSFVMFRRKLRVDLETTGNAEFEVIRNARGDIQGFNHLPSYQVYLSKLDRDPIKVSLPIYRLLDDGVVEIENVPVWKRFRSYVQTWMTSIGIRSMSGSLEKRWFKEFGDPRIYNNETGEEVTGADIYKLPEERRANEIVHMRLYSPRSPYGLPRIIGNLLSVYGDRASEEINYTTFRNNNVPSMLLLVSNGQLTQATIDRLTEFVATRVQGSDNYSKFVVIEAESPDIEGESPGHAKLDVKPLASEQHKDALFQNYSAHNREKIRRAFRIPPVLVGQAEAYNRAVAETSRRIADEQIFSPERDEFDSLINRRLFPVMGVRYHKFKSNSPNTTDNTELVRILAGAEKTGGMTPRIARILLEDILGTELPPFPDDFPADRPFSETMAEAVKNLASPVEPGQTVTALKMIEQLTGSDIPLFEQGITDADLVDRLIGLRNQLEKQWRSEVYTEE